MILNQPLVTFLIPTRKRLASLKAAIESLENTATDLKSFEVVVIFDEDDIETINQFKATSFKCTVKLLISVRHGYYGLHHYINDSFIHSLGMWFWLWNDDLTMVANGWDEVIRGYGSRFIILNPTNSNSYWREYCRDATISPVVPRQWFNLLGRFSAYSQYDTYINSIGYRLNIVCNEPRLVNCHEQIRDEVSAGISYDKSIFPRHESDHDFMVLRDYLGWKILLLNRIERTPYLFDYYLRRKKRHFKRMFSIDYLTSRLTLNNIINKAKKLFRLG